MDHGPMDQGTPETLRRVLQRRESYNYGFCEFTNVMTAFDRLTENDDAQCSISVLITSSKNKS